MASRKPYEFQDVPRTIGGRPLMPSAMANRLRDGLRATAGTILLLVLVAVWLSLISWSVQDPSLSHATARAARNWLGTPGAICADLIVQTFGLASLVLLLAPMFWSLAFIQKETVPKFTRRLSGYMASVVTLAAAASAVSAPALWPLHPGLGGIVGDAAFRVASAPFAVAHAEFGAPVAGVVLLAIGLWSAVASLGLGGARQGRTKTVRNTSGHAATRGTQRVEPELTVRASPTFRAQPAPAGPGATQRQHERFGPYHAAVVELEDDPLDPEFDAWTEAASSGMAARFAPTNQDDLPPMQAPGYQTQGNAPRTMQDTLSTAFAVSPHDALPSHEMAFDAAYDVLPSSAPQTARPAAPAKTQTYKRPSLNLLERPAGSRAKANYTDAMLRGNARLLEDVFADFGVIGEIRDIVPGPVVTNYELEPARGTNPARSFRLPTISPAA